MGFGGLGFATTDEINFPNWKPYVGKIDEFYLWARPVQIWEVASIQKKEFITHEDYRCRQNPKYDFVLIKKPNKLDCADDCQKEIACVGYEVKQKKYDAYRCVKYYNNPPPLGQKITSTGNKPECALLA